MPENSIQKQASYPRPKVVSISKNAEKREPVKYNKPHCIIPVVDMTWVLNQAKSIQSLWNECWQSDPFGSRFVKLTTSLKDTAFRVARKVLSAAGLFEFKRDTCTEDTRKTAGWLVINLHGARRIKEFWNSEPIDDINSPIDGETALTSVIDTPISSADLTISSAAALPISSETIANTGVLEPLSIYSLSSQEILKEVPEKKESTTAELFERVRLYASEKTAQKLKGVFERCLKKTHVETNEDFYKDLFLSRYNWRIDDQRLLQILELNQDCQQAFIQRFQYTHKTDGASISLSFEKAINFVRNDTERITEVRSKHSEYWEELWNRREQAFGNTALQT
ncbi:MAG: hypothetical protein V7L23_09985 [Nostoc sp.]|uniref:hypothetical protein n=1 Tax=Nostoc sp. TaxID=1180 RepID=UPI002FF02126